MKTNIGIIKVWSIQKWDGGERQIHSFYLTSEAEAKKYLETHKHDAAVETILHIWDTVEEAEANNYRAIKERAMAKLTPEELIILGIK